MKRFGHWSLLGLLMLAQLAPTAARAELDPAADLTSACAYGAPQRPLDARFGVIMVGHAFDNATTQCVLNTLGAATWYATPSVEGSKFSLAGRWYGYVSLPIFQFLLCRWYFRLLIWARFLWQVSRIELNVAPMHPDRVGGLGFLSSTVDAFVPLAVAHGALLAGQFANRIFYLGAALPGFKVEVGVMVIFLLCVVFGPLLVFAPQLAQARRTGLREFGTLAQRYVREFDAKWLRGRAPADEPFVGSADIQSLADLGNSYEMVRTMRVAPITKEAVFRVVAATVAPIVPLALTMMPLEELLKKLLGILF